ncbi:Rdx family protein [bacterium]|nr:Rdx family protein [candidate division CSSED10-310 bacterium]
MAEELEREFGVKAKLNRGGGGIFDVVVDGEKIFSKFDAWRFPEPGEIVKLIKKQS